MCSSTGRGYPDIAAQALDYVIVVKGNALVASGTSCSTPVRIYLALFLPPLCRPSSSIQLTSNVQTAAGIISLLNDYLISKRKPPLGFLNPLLYGDGLEGFKDIISGSNPGCDTPGFSAIEGWDPVRTTRPDSSFSTLTDFFSPQVTGLGTPDLQALLKILNNLYKID